MKKLIIFSSVLLGIYINQINAQSYVQFKIQPAIRYERIKPIWNGLNWFFPNFAIDNEGNPNTWYRETQPFINRIVLVTATGGRPDYPQWEILKKDNDNSFYYDFSYFDQFLDATLSLNYKPIIVFGSIPIVLAPENYFVGSFGTITNPPTDFNKWHEFVKKVATHCVERYGETEVLSWAWRIYTEPDNPSWWTGTKEEYFKLYDFSADAIRSALPDAEVGPGNMLGDIENNWGIEILDHAFNETNYYTGSIGTPIDFFTISAYESCEKEFPPLNKFETRLLTIKTKLQQYNALNSVELGFDEGQLLLDEDNRYLWGGDGTEYGAAWQAAYQILGLRDNLNRIVQWNFTSDGVKTPKYNTIEMLEMLKNDTRIDMNLEQDTREQLVQSLNKIDGIASVNGSEDILKIFLFSQYKYRNAGFGYADSQLVKIHIDKLPYNSEIVYIRHWMIDKTHSNFFTKWLDDSKDIKRIERSGMEGSIYDAELLSVLDQDGKSFWYAHKEDYTNIDDLEKAAPDYTLPVQNDGALSFEIYVHPHQVSLIEISDDSLFTGITKDLINKNKISFNLSNYPNPFNGQTTINYSLNKPLNVKIELFNIEGRLIKILKNGYNSAGDHRITWDGKDSNNNPVASGSYICRIKAGNRIETRKIMYLK